MAVASPMSSMRCSLFLGNEQNRYSPLNHTSAEKSFLWLVTQVRSLVPSMAWHKSSLGRLWFQNVKELRWIRILHLCSSQKWHCVLLQHGNVTASFDSNLLTVFFWHTATPQQSLRAYTQLNTPSEFGHGKGFGLLPGDSRHGTRHLLQTCTSMRFP